MKTCHLLLACVVVVSALGGCSESDQGCGGVISLDSLHIELDPPITEEGDYTIEIGGDKVDVTCTLTVGEVEWIDCDGDVEVLTQVDHGEMLTELRSLYLIFETQCPCRSAA